MKSIVLDAFEESLVAIEACSMDKALSKSLQRAGMICSDALRDAKKIILIGNGGSATDAQHIAAELTGRFSRVMRPALGAMALSSDTAAITAIANDFGYEYVFSRQLEALGRAGDVLIAISTSGTSKNVLQAAVMAKNMNMKLITMTGNISTIMSEQADVALYATTPKTARIQECHRVFGHILCELIEYSLFEDPHGKKH